MNSQLRYLFMIRAIAMSGLALGLAIMHAVFELRVPVAVLSITIAALGLFSVWSWQSLKSRSEISDSILMLQLFADMLALTIVVYFTGGSVNPFISLFILPVIFAAAGMQFHNAALIAALAFGSYTLLMFFNQPLMDAHDHSAATNLHLWGMWYGFALSAVLVALFVARIGTSLRRRDKALADARAENLRADKAIALGTLAAGTAHELGTPLSTMAVICHELDQQLKHDPETAKDISILNAQIQRCKDILARMANDAGALQAEASSSGDLGEYLEKLIADWHNSRPGISLKLARQGERPQCLISADRALTQALTNVLHNAADAARESVEISLYWDAEQLRVEVKDDGPGVSKKVQRRLGNTSVSTKTEGMGIGLLLATTTIQRLGGSLVLEPAQGTGTLARIDIPIQKLRAD